MHERLRLGVIGGGGIGFAHVEHLRRCARAEVVAVADADPARAAEATRRFGLARAFTDYRELLVDAPLDAVTIALPNHLHAPAALAALRAGKHVLLEKPMAMNATEAAEIIAVARATGRVLMVGQNFRFSRHTQAAKAAIGRGEPGHIYAARCFWLRRTGIPRLGSWFTQKQTAGGGCLADLGVHMLDLCLHLLGDFEVRSVSAATSANFGPRGLRDFDWGRGQIDPSRPFDVEDHGTALVRLRDGRTITLEASWAGNHPADAREQGVDLLGTEASLSLFPARLHREAATGPSSVEIDSNHPPITEDRLHHFVDCVLDGREPLVTLDESLKLQQILDAIYLSAEKGEEVKLA